MATNRYFTREITPYNPVVRPLPFDQILQAGLLKQQSLDNARLAADELEDQALIKPGRSTIDLARAKNDYYQGKIAGAASDLDNPDYSINEVSIRIRDINRELKNDRAVQAINEDFALKAVAGKTEADQNFVSGNFESKYWDHPNNRWSQITQEDIDSGLTINASRYAPVYGTDFSNEHASLINQIVPDVQSSAIKESGLESGDFQLINGKVHVFDDTKREKYQALTREKLSERLSEYVYNSDTPLSESDKQSVRFRSIKGERTKDPYNKDEYFNELMRQAQLGIFSNETTYDGTTSKSAAPAPADDKSTKSITEGTLVNIGAEDITNKFNLYKVRHLNDVRDLGTPEGRKEVMSKMLGDTEITVDGKYKNGEELSEADKEFYDEISINADSDQKFFEEYDRFKREEFLERFGYEYEHSEEVLDPKMIKDRTIEEYSKLSGIPMYTRTRGIPGVSTMVEEINPNLSKSLDPSDPTYDGDMYREAEGLALRALASEEDKYVKKFNEELKANLKEWSAFRMGILLDPEGNDSHATLERDIQNIMYSDLATIRGKKKAEGKDKTKSGDLTFSDVLSEVPGYNHEDFRITRIFLAEDERGSMQWYSRGSFVPQTGSTAAPLPEKYTKGKSSQVDINITEVVDDITGLKESKEFHIAGAIRDKAFTTPIGKLSEFIIPGIRSNPGSNFKIKKSHTGVEIFGDVYLKEDGQLKRMDVMDAYNKASGNNIFPNPETAAKFMIAVNESNNRVDEAVGGVFDPDNFDKDSGLYIGPNIDGIVEGLGDLSNKYESRGDSTTIRYDSTGGHSYGESQIATRTGTFKQYMNFLKSNHPDIHSELSAAGGNSAATAGSGVFKDAWKRVMSDEDSAKSQKEFIKSTHYDPAVSKLKSELGLDIAGYSTPVKNVIWSTAVQHGHSGAVSIVRKAIKSTGKSIKDLSEVELIKAIYAERGRKDGSGSLIHFKRSKKSVQDSVSNRFINEMADALRSLS